MSNSKLGSRTANDFLAKGSRELGNAFVSRESVATETGIGVHGNESTSPGINPALVVGAGLATGAAMSMKEFREEAQKLLNVGEKGLDGFREKAEEKGREIGSDRGLEM